MIAGGPSKLARILWMGQIVRASAEGILLEGQGNVWIEESIVKEISLWQRCQKSMIAGGPSKLARVLQIGQIVCASAEEILLQDYKENYKEKVMKKLMY